MKKRRKFSDLTVIQRVCRYIERGWTKSYLAVDKYDDVVPPGDRRACRWCILGALEKAVGRSVTRSLQARRIGLLIHQEVVQEGFRDILAFNDSPQVTLQRVQLLLYRCSARIKGQQS